MVVLSKPGPAIQHLSIPIPNISTATLLPPPPSIDLSDPDNHTQSLRLLQACEDFGFFKVTNHAIPLQLIQKLESKAFTFFSLPPCQKSKAPGYGDKKIGPNGDVGWLEYLLLTANDATHKKFSSVFGDDDAEDFRCVVTEYISAVKKMACRILEMLAEALKIEPRNAWSKLLVDEQSDSVFRVNHYPPCPEASNGRNLMGFGEHTDPQIISVLRSNNTGGLQISLRDGTWMPVPPDHTSFFINVGDALQVMSNGRLKSVRHRVVANGRKSRVSMIYFGGPPLGEKIVPFPSLLKGDHDTLYKEFTWFEYKKSAYQSRLSDNRLALFHKFPQQYMYST